MDIKYNIEMHSYWHCGTGLSAGGDADALVIKDMEGLPYIPGRTMKGLIREAAEELFIAYGGTEEQMKSMFGIPGGQNGCLFFSDATVTEGREMIAAKGLAQYAYREISSTELDSGGIAKDGSLRKMEVAIPCRLSGTIMSVPEDGFELITKSLAYVKRLGVNRNRGLGRCTITVEK